MENRDLIEVFTQNAKEELQYVIDKYTFSNKNQCNFNLKGVVPDEYLTDVALFLKSKMTKLGYKIIIIDNMLVVSWR